jgi:hypothetical protein
MWANSQRSRKPPTANTSPSVLTTTTTNVITSPPSHAEEERRVIQEEILPDLLLPIVEPPAPTTEVAKAPWRIPRKVAPSTVSLGSFRTPAGGPDVGVISILADGSVVATTDVVANADAGATIESSIGQDLSTSYRKIPTTVLGASPNPRSVRWKSTTPPALIEPYIRKKRKKKKKPNHLKLKNIPFPRKFGIYPPTRNDDESSVDSFASQEEGFEFKIIRTKHTDEDEDDT